MRRAGRLARRRTARVAVDAVAVAVVLVPHVRAPLGGVRQHLLRVLLLSVLGAELLSELHGSGRAVLHASAAGDAFLLVHPRDIGASAHVRGVEELRSAQGVAYLDVAVAYRENLALAVDIGDLVDVAIVLGALEYGHGLFVADGAATSGLAAVVRHVANGDAPVLVVVGAAFVQLLASVAAGAYGCAYMAFVPLEPVGNVLYVNGLVLHRNGLLHRDDVHSDSGSSRRNHGGHVLQRQEGHPLEEHGKLRMAVHQGRVHVGVLRRARYKERNPVLAVLPVIARALDRAVLGVFVAVVVFQHAEIGELVEQFVEFFVSPGVVFFVVPLHKLAIWTVFAHRHRLFGHHVKQQVERSLPGLGVHLVLEDARQSPVLRVIGGHTFDFCRDTVCYLGDEFQKLGIRICISLVFGNEFL